MKLAAQENLIPGLTFREKVENLASYGYEGVELRGDGLAERVSEIQTVLKDSFVEATCICGGFKFGLLFPDKADRDQSRHEIKELLTLAAEIGAKDGVIVVPIFGSPRIPDLTPWKTSRELQEEILVEQLHELAEYAGKVGTKLLLEPLNRYETHYINRLEQAASICKRVQSPNLKILDDFFHMNIEEADFAESIKKTSDWIGYVHLADSNRILPGQGHLNFKEGFAALQEIGYEGWMSLECGVQGDPASALSESARFLKSQMTTNVSK